MNPDLRDLYQDVILEHSRHPRNFRVIANPTHHAEGNNPLCGDKVSLTLIVENGVIKDLAFQGSGCAISQSSNSLLTEFLKGKTIGEAETIFKNFHSLVTGEKSDVSLLGKLEVFEGVGEFPARVKCATLGWHTLKAALENKQAPISTE